MGRDTISGNAIALDIGTSGIRGQLLDISSGKIIRTSVLSRNPLPGSNVMDHLTFAIDHGTELARRVLLSSVNSIISSLGPKDLRRVSVCGNPIQLSLFEGIEIRDLAYAGENKIRNENIIPAERKGHIVPGDTIGVSANVDVVIPPAIKHEIGADALAMMLRSGFLDDDMCMVTDYGTNAEMALKIGDRIYTGSAAAGPALEGQQMTSGMLAGPGAISDLERTPEGWLMKVLDDSLDVKNGPILNIRSNIVRKQGLAPTGITGTGVIALIYAGMADGRMEPPKIRRGPVYLGRNISFTENDLKEAGKAIGAIRAGHMTLMNEATVHPNEIRTMYMTGASGTYVDAVKAKSVGIVPSGSKKIIQAGNTSLGLAREMAVRPEMIDELNSLVKEISARHIMFASSPVFSSLYIMELAYWTEGMPLRMYETKLETMGLGGCLDNNEEAIVDRRCVRDIQDVGDSLLISEPDVTLTGSWECERCMRCVTACPEKALSFTDPEFTINTGRCLGSACMRCEAACEKRMFRRSAFGLNSNTS